MKKIFSKVIFSACGLVFLCFMGLEGVIWTDLNSNGSAGSNNFIGINSFQNQDIIAVDANGNTFYKQPTDPMWFLRGNAGITGVNASSFVDQNEGWIAGNNSKVFHTTNGGRLWLMQSTEFQHDHFLGVKFYNSRRGIITGTTGIIYTTTNGGSTWTYREGDASNPNLKGIAFADSDNVYVSGCTGSVLHSSNGGNSWTKKNTGSFEFLNDIATSGDSDIVAAGNNGTIITSFDKGTTWTSRNSGTTANLYTVGVDPGDENKQFVAGDSGIVLFSTNRGVNWARETTGTKKRVRNIICADTNAALITGDSGMVFRRHYVSTPPAPTNLRPTIVTSDSGIVEFGANSQQASKVIFYGRTSQQTNYTKYGETPATRTSYTLTGLQEDTRYYFYAQSEANGLYSANSNIATFRTRLRSPNLTQTYVIHTPQKNKIRLDWQNKSQAVAQNQIYRGDTFFVSLPKKLSKTESTFQLVATVDGNVTSFDDSVLVSGHHYSYYIKAVNDSSYSENSNIMSISYNVVGMEENDQVPTQFELFQNYPNPFNPVTIITYQLPNSAIVDLRIYDSLGKEVCVLVNESQNPGKYRIDWNGHYLSSGVYYYKLAVKSSTEQKSLVRKMVLLK